MNVRIYALSVGYLQIISLNGVALLAIHLGIISGRSMTALILCKDTKIRSMNLNELSLFSGAGGGLLGSKLLGWRHVGYVEYEKYCQEIINQRIKDGFLDEAPIFGDIDEFIKSGASKKYKGYVDVVTAGFPCQPFSVAGKQKGQDDERNKWPQTLQCIRDIQPRYAFLENVPGLLNSGYFSEILSSLAQAGYNARWIVLGADDVGAWHRRKRLWIKAELAVNTNSISMGWNERPSQTVRPQIQESERQESQHIWEDISQTGNVADSDSPRLQQSDEAMAGESPEQFDSGSIQSRKNISNSYNKRLEGRIQDRKFDTERRKVESDGCLTKRSIKRSRNRDSEWWATEPDVGRVAHGVARRVDRLKAVGNGQVPSVVKQAWEILSYET